MDFVLRYRGPLPANGSIKEKHQIREIIHAQLQHLCELEPLLQQAMFESLPEAVFVGREIQVPRPMTVMYFSVALGGFRFVPIIHQPHGLACALDILFLRRERPGAIIVHGGDLDNRIKTLFDALRMPQEASELKGITPKVTNQRLYCLLQDDALITRVSVSTQQLLEPLADGEHPSSVELLIHVTVQSTYPMYANIGF